MTDENLNVFPNAKSPLFGAGENSVGIIETDAVAGLTGSLVLDESQFLGGQVGLNANGFPASGTASRTESIVDSRAITVTEVDNVLIVRASAFTGTNGASRAVTFRIRENNLTGNIIGGVTVATSGGSPSSTNSTEWQIKIFVINISASVTSIVLTRQHTGPTGPSEGFQGTYAFDVWLVEGDDTHAGFIQSVAVAGKNIITPDSHTTREISVLPG